MSKLYWTPVYDHGTKTDRILELEQVADGSDTWRVTVDDKEFTMTTATQSSDFWNLVAEAISLRQSQ